MSSVYVSCSLDSSSHISEIRELIRWLAEKGIAAEADTGDPFQPEEWHKQRLEESEAILVIASSMYYSAVMQNSSPGKGVQWTGDLIRQAMFSREEIAEKAIPVLLSNGKKVHVLTILKDKEILSFPDDQDRLLQTLGHESGETEREEEAPKSILDHLKEGEIAPALDMMEEDDRYKGTDELISFQGRFARLNKQIKQGTISAENQTLTYNQILYGILNYLEEDETN